MSSLEHQKVLHLSKELEKKKPNINYFYIIKPKLDGWFVYVDYINGVWQDLKSSADRIIPAFSWMKEEDFFKQQFPKIPFSRNFRLIFEATIDDLPFHIINGIFNRSVGDCSCRNVTLNLHKIIFLNDTFSDTHLDLDTESYNLYKFQPTFSADIRYIFNLGISNNQKVWQNYAEQEWAKDGEGVVLTRTDGIYCPGKRNSGIMKIKLEDSFDLLCIDAFWTTGEKGNEAFNLKLINKNNVIVNVLVGSHKERDKMQKDSPINKVIEIRCMKELEDGSYREPRFKCVREDKKSTDIN